MSFNLIIPFIAATIMAAFVIYVLQRYFARRRPEFLFWGIGLGMFALASYSEAILSLAWNRWVFFSWYLFGAVLNAAWIGQGTLYLMVKKDWRKYLTILLAAGSLYSAFLMFQVMDTLDESVFDFNVPISEQFGTKELDPGENPPPGVIPATIVHNGELVRVIPGILPLGSSIRSLTPFFNIYGTLWLVGGALYSAYLFWRKRVLPNRVVANVLIAGGAISVAFVSTLTRFGYGQFLYAGELVAAILMFWGFLLAAKPQPNEETVPLDAVPAPN